MLRLRNEIERDSQLRFIHYVNEEGRRFVQKVVAVFFRWEKVVAVFFRREKVVAVFFRWEKEVAVFYRWEKVVAALWRWNKSGIILIAMF